MSEKTERRGRPVEQVFEQPEKWIREFYEVPSKPELGYKTTFYYDINKSVNGPYKTEITYPKNYKQGKQKSEERKTYGKQPVVVVFKTSERSNAKTKMKVFNNKNIDEVLDENVNLPGIPDNAVFMDIGVGECFINQYKRKYEL
jgi:hypothetical protein